MAQQIRFFEKNKCDYSNILASATATEGNDYAPYVLNRSNKSAWVTTGSSDAALTTMVIDFTEERYLDSVLLVKMNFGSYTLKYWNGSAFVDFATPVSVTGNTVGTKFHSFPEVLTSKLELVITGTMIADEDKFLHQFIATSQMGQLVAWPIINNPTHDKSLVVTKMLSGKVNVTAAVGYFKCELEVAQWRGQEDLDLIERIYQMNEGVLVWLCGGDEDQFAQKMLGYRLEDIFLMRPTNAYVPEFDKGIYSHGVKLKISLSESGS